MKKGEVLMVLEAMMVIHMEMQLVAEGERVRVMARKVAVKRIPSPLQVVSETNELAVLFVF